MPVSDIRGKTVKPIQDFNSIFAWNDFKIKIHNCSSRFKIQLFPLGGCLSPTVAFLVITSYLTLTPILTTIVQYANSLDPNETPSNSASHLDPSCLTLRQFHQR